MLHRHTRDTELGELLTKSQGLQANINLVTRDAFLSRGLTSADEGAKTWTCPRPPPCSTTPK